MKEVSARPEVALAAGIWTDKSLGIVHKPEPSGVRDIVEIVVRKESAIGSAVRDKEIPDNRDGEQREQ
jgi:hypothetical protein